MATVKQLMAKFQTKASAGNVLTPVSFEENMKMTRARELEEIRLAKEKAKKYNATLRAKTIQMAKEQSQKMRGVVPSPRNANGSSRGFNFEGATNPSFSNASQTIVEESSLYEGADMPVSSGFSAADVEGEEKSVYELPGYHEQNIPGYLAPTPAHFYATGTSMTPTSSSHHVLERHGSSFEEKKDVLTELPSHSPAGGRTSRLSQQKEAILSAQLAAAGASSSSSVAGGGLMNSPSSAVSVSGASAGGGGAVPPAEDIPTTFRPLSATRSQYKNLTSAPSMTDVNISAMAATRATSYSPTSRKDSDLGSVSSIAVLVPEQPEGGFEEIHEAVRFNRPSVSDLLLKPTLGERNYSVTSVGPMVESPSEEPCRLLPGVDLRTVLHTFYSTYAPEKLEDLDLVLKHFRGRTEALLFTLECKYFVAISPEGYITPFRPSEAPPEFERVEDERVAARRSTMLSTATDMTDFTTDSYKGYIPADAKDGGLPSTLANSWAVRPKHDSGGAKREGRKTALFIKKGGSDLL